MTHSRWNWLLLPVFLVIAYALMTWCLWVPLSRNEVATKSGVFYVPYWEGQVIAFTATRLMAATLLSLLCLVVVPCRRWEPALAGVLTGLAISVLDRYSFNWINYHAGFIAALFVIPLIAASLVILPLDIGLRRGSQALTDHT